MLHDRRHWKLRWRAVGEPLIWRDTPWQRENRRYIRHTEVFVEDVLWQERDASFPNQLNALRVGEQRLAGKAALTIVERLRADLVHTGS
jgi:hypothetical protein